ncbi:MAG TPA: hypothetical protein VEL76_02660 [Gemmataceae bacterium]|nr:hypothetical protein [Gemmataceae bacterium]
MLLQEPVQAEQGCPRRWSHAAAGGLFALALLVPGVGLRAEAQPPVIGIATPDKDAKAEPNKVREFSLPVSKTSLVEEINQDFFVDRYRKEIARHEEVMGQWKALAARPEQETAYQSAKAALVRAQQSLAERQKELRLLTEQQTEKIYLEMKLADLLRKTKGQLPKDLNIKVEIQGLGTARQGEVLTTVMRTGDRFTTRYQEGSLIITLTGTVADGKAKVGEIHVQDGRVEHTYERVEGVPARYRDKVNHMLSLSAHSHFHSERK